MAQSDDSREFGQDVWGAVGALNDAAIGFLDESQIRGHNTYLISQGIRGISGAVYQLDTTLCQAKADIISYNSNSFRPQAVEIKV